MDGAAATQAEGHVVLQPQTIPPPQAISDAARTYLATPFWAGDRPPLAADDLEGWKAAIAEVDLMMAPMVEGMLAASEADVEKTTMAGVTVYVGTPRTIEAGRQGQVHLYIHGGGWAFMCGEACRGQAALQASKLGLRTYAVDYRNPPEHRFPAALDDCVAVYRELLKSYRPEDIVISGMSAGGNLTAATALRIRDEGLPWPAAVGMMTPCVDGAFVSDTLATNAQFDIVLKPHTMAEFWAVYAGSHDRTDPYLSPLHADFGKGFPPALLQSGTRDLLLSDTVRLHRALRNAGVVAELHIWEAMPHGGFSGLAPEDAELTTELKAFFARHLGRSMAEDDPGVTVMSLAVAYWSSRCLHIIADLGVADVLGDAPQTAEALATGLDVQPQVLHRVLRNLSSHGMFEMKGDRFVHNDASRLLRTDSPTSMRSFSRMMGMKVHWDAYRELDHSLRTGQPAIDQVAEGGLFGYLRTHSEDAQLFHEAMVGKSFAQIGGVLAAYDFTRFGRIGDIGGGLGHLLNAVLESAPGAEGVLFELPEVAARAEATPNPRVRYVGGDFFQDEIPACDAYLMMTVLHDWSDEESIRILGNLKQTAPKHAKLLLVEGVVGQGGLADFATDVDIEMLVMTTGRERTEPEWRQLLTDAGFQLTGVFPAGWCSVIEATIA